jgi:hypothetical protein
MATPYSLFRQLDMVKVRDVPQKHLFLAHRQYVLTRLRYCDRVVPPWVALMGVFRGKCVLTLIAT